MNPNDNRGVSSQGHGHSHASAGELLREGSAAGIRALRISAIGLLITSAVQFTVVAIGGSVGLFADALHNLGDVLTSAVLWVALIATRRAADHRYTFGYQRFEDLAGLGIVIAIFGSAAIAGVFAIMHLVNHTVPTHLALGMAAGGVGFIGNEIVAQVKVRQGRKIGSAALIAEGQHSRVDGLASLTAIAGLIGVAAGWDQADPIAGLILAGVIVAVGVQAAFPIISTLTDKVDPELIHRIEHAVEGVEDIAGAHDVRARWAGRALYVVLNVSLPPDMPLADAHQRTEEARHAVIHEFPEVVQVDIHADPAGADHAEFHQETAHHFERS